MGRSSDLVLWGPSSIEHLIEQRADVNYSRGHGESLLGSAASRGLLEAIDFLMLAKADIEKPCTDEGATPLFIAALGGEAHAAQLLINAKADVNRARPLDGATPASIAA